MIISQRLILLYVITILAIFVRVCLYWFPYLNRYYLAVIVIISIAIIIIIIRIIIIIVTRVVSQLRVATAPPAATIACATVWTTFRTCYYHILI